MSNDVGFSCIDCGALSAAPSLRRDHARGVRGKATAAKKKGGLSEINALRVEKMPRRGPASAR